MPFLYHSGRNLKTYNIGMHSTKDTNTTTTHTPPNPKERWEILWYSPSSNVHADLAARGQEVLAKIGACE